MNPSARKYIHIHTSSAARVQLPSLSLLESFRLARKSCSCGTFRIAIVDGAVASSVVF